MVVLRPCLVVLVLGLVNNLVHSVPRVEDRVVLQDSGYEGVVVALQDDIPVNLCQEVLIGLQESLQSASTSISTATRSWASLRTVTVVVPRSWSPSLCPRILGISDAKRESWDNADIRVTSAQDPKHGILPWTQQSQGCGKQGDYISVAHNLFRQNSSLVNGRLLAHEWFKYRYGVFEEIGQVGNPQHPPHYRAPDGSWKPNACANQHLKESSNCDPGSVGCDLRIEQEDNPTLTSSFMAFPTVHSVQDLCDEGSHDRFAPTRHNLACHGKSIWEVMRASTDFQDSSNSEGRAVDSLVSLRYVYPQRQRIVLLVDDTNVMNSQKRWDFMRKAVRKVVTYDIPEAFSVGLAVFDSRAKVKHSLTPLVDYDVREKVGSSLPRNPSVVGENQRCVLCGIKTSLDMLKKNGGTGGNIILVTGGSSTISDADKQKARILLKNAGVTLHLIIYPLIDRFPVPGSNLEYLTAISGGESFIIPDEGIGEDSRVSMYYGLLDALYNTVGNIAEWRGLPVKLHEAEHPGGLSVKSEGSFLVDPSLSSNINFAIFFYDVGHVGNAVHLISPHNQEIDTSNMQSEDGNMNMIVVKLSGSQVTPGLWRYSVDNKADSHQGLFIQVTSKSYSSIGHNSKVEVKGWTNYPSGEVNASDVSKPLALFAEVRAGGNAVEGAKVTANLTRLGLTTNGTLYKPQEVVLVDNGFMDPDMLQSDGVYSRYVPNLSSGKFSVSLYIEGIIGQYKFARHVRVGVLNVIEGTPKTDMVPPSRIVDLRMALLPDTPNKVSFIWTAPGDDYDFGIASKYIVAVGPTPDLDDNWEVFKEDFSLTEDWPEPLPASSIQQHTVDWDIFENVRYVGIFALDSNDNASPISNVVSVFVPYPPTTTASPSIFSSVHISNTAEVRENDGSHGIMSGFNLIIVMVFVAAFVFIILISTAFCLLTRNKGKASKKASDIPKPFNPNVTGVHEKNFGNRTDSKESIKKEFISPVESWSASQLLGGHTENKRNSVSARSDGTSDHSDSTKKSYTGFSATNDFYGNQPQYIYNPAMYQESYHPPSESYPTPTEGFPTPVEGYNIPPEAYSAEAYPASTEHRSYSNPPSESFLSVSCDLLPVTHGAPPGYSAYPGYDATLRSGAKVPPPIPPKPKVMYSPEPYQYDHHDSSSTSPSINGTEKRVRNVTMV